MVRRFEFHNGKSAFNANACIANGCIDRTINNTDAELECFGERNELSCSGFDKLDFRLGRLDVRFFSCG